MTQTVTTPRRPTPPPKNALPAGVILSRYWKETPDGQPIKHDHERPVVDATDVPVGVWWMCPEVVCPVGEWVFPRADGELSRPKKKGCPDHVRELLPGRSEPADDDPKRAARGRLQQALAEKNAAMRRAATDAANARITSLRNASREEAGHIREALREHVPSAAVSLAALVTDWALLENLGGLETYAVATCMSVGGTVLAYWAVYLGEIVWARRMGYTLKELPRAIRARAMSHARWVASGVLASGVWLLMGETIGAGLDNWRGVLMNLFGALLIGLVNYNPWAKLVERRKAAASAVREAAEAAAQAEEDRLAAEKSERERRQQAVEAARLAAEEQALADARRIVSEDDDHITAGRKFAERWAQMTAAAKEHSINPGVALTKTSVVVDQTRKLTLKQGDEEIVVGWEFLIKAQPGTLAPRSGIQGSPFLSLGPFLSSMLEIDEAKIELGYQPTREGEDGKQETLMNHGVVTLSETFALGETVRHPGAGGCSIDAKGARYGYLGRGLRGQPVHRVNWAPGRPGGGNIVGITGAGKSVNNRTTAYNDLLLGIFPIIHDAGKRLQDYLPFLGIIPMGFTNEHRDVISASIWAEMERRYAWSNKRTVTGLGGMIVPAEQTWDGAGGPPIRVFWDEFHMHMRDPKFVQFLTMQIRLQRATAIMAETSTQGGGLADMGDHQLREQLNDVFSVLLRVSDHTASLTGYTGNIRPNSLPNIPGMAVMQENRGEAVAFRSAFLDADPTNPESLIYRLRDHNNVIDGEGQQLLFAPTLPPETMAVFKEHGLIDLWELGKTRSGRERLLSEFDPVQSTALPADALAAAILGNVPQPASKPRMQSDAVVLAMLKNQLEAGHMSMVQVEMLNSPWWKLIDGEWSKNDSGLPSPSTVKRACDRLLASESPQITRDDSEKQARWSLTPAGLEKSEQALTILRAAGLLGRKEQARAQASGIDVVAMERQAMLEAETQVAIQEAVRQAHEAINGPSTQQS